MNTKLHAVTDAIGRPITFFMSAGQVSDYTGAAALLRELPEADWLLADRGYDADWFRDAFERQRDKALHPWSKEAQDPCEIRQATLQTAQPDRDHVRSAKGLAQDRHSLRQMPKGVPFRSRARSNRPLLAVNINESGA